MSQVDNQGIYSALAAPFEPVWAIDATWAHGMLNALAALRVEALAIADTPDEKLPVTIDDGIAVISVWGPMTKRPSVITKYLNGTPYVDIERAVEKVRAADGVHAVVLDVDSPGGTVDGQSLAFDALETLAYEIPVVAQVTGIATSAAYWLALAAGEMYANRSDTLGSIGVRILLYDWSKLFRKAGVEAVPIDTGANKSVGAMGTKVTAAQRKALQEFVNATFDDFRAAVQINRGMDNETFAGLGDGRVVTAGQSVDQDMQLIDGVRTMKQTLAALRAKPRSGGQSAGKSGATSMAEKKKAGDAATETDAASAETKTDAGQKPAPVAATVKELEAAIPGAEADFVVACLKEGRTVDQAVAAHKDHVIEGLSADVKAKGEKIAELTAAVEKAEAKTEELAKALAASGTSGVAHKPEQQHAANAAAMQRDELITKAKKDFAEACRSSVVATSELNWVNGALREANGNRPAPLTEDEIRQHGIKKDD
jgi:signal peptide peptidase SppA